MSNRTIELLENLRKAANELSEEFLTTELNNLKSNEIYPFEQSFDVIADKINAWTNAVKCELEGKELYKVTYKNGHTEIIPADHIGEDSSFNHIFTREVISVELMEARSSKPEQKAEFQMTYNIHDLQSGKNKYQNLTKQEVKDFVFTIVKDRVEALDDELSQEWRPHVEKGAENLDWEVVEDVIYNWEYRLTDINGNKLIGYK